MFTPLNSIINLTNLLKLKLDVKSMKASQKSYSNSSPEETLYLIKIVNNSAIMMQYLVQDLLDLQKIMNGTLKSEDDKVNIAKVCADVLELFEVQLQQKGLKQSVEISDKTPDVLEFDYKKYQQVLLNLIQNAVKFTRDGGFQIYLDFDQST